MEMLLILTVCLYLFEVGSCIFNKTHACTYTYTYTHTYTHTYIPVWPAELWPKVPRPPSRQDLPYCLVLSCLVLSCLVLSGLVLCYVVLSWHIILYCVVLYCALVAQSKRHLTNYLVTDTVQEDHNTTVCLVVGDRSGNKVSL